MYNIFLSMYLRTILQETEDMSIGIINQNLKK